jgi:hypothetical protein
MCGLYLVWFIVFSSSSHSCLLSSVLEPFWRPPGGVGTFALRLEKSHISGSVAERNAAIHRLFPLLKLGSEDSTLRKWYFLSWEASSRPSSRMPHVKPDDSFRVPQELVIVPYLICMCPAHTLIPCFFEMSLNINSDKSSLKFIPHFFLSFFLPLSLSYVYLVCNFIRWK